MYSVCVCVCVCVCVWVCVLVWGTERDVHFLHEDDFKTVLHIESETRLCLSGTQTACIQ